MYNQLVPISILCKVDTYKTCTSLFQVVSWSSLSFHPCSSTACKTTPSIQPCPLHGTDGCHLESYRCLLVTIKSPCMYIVHVSNSSTSQFVGTSIILDGELGCVAHQHWWATTQNAWWWECSAFQFRRNRWPPLLPNLGETWGCS